MKSKRHVFLDLGMTSIEFRELMTTLSLAPECCPYARELATRLYEAEKESDPEVLWHYEEESENIALEREMCEEDGCENKRTDDDEAPEGLCQPCREKYVWVNGRVGQKESWGWVKRSS